MEQKHLSNWLKLILVGVALCGLVVYALVVPMYGMSLRSQYPEFSNRFWPWLLFIWVSGIPCFAVLGYAWKIATNIGNDRSFTDQNASLLKTISILSALDAAFFFVGNIVLLFLNMSHRERVCQDDFCKFSKFKYLSAEKSPNISCLHIS